MPPSTLRREFIELKRTGRRLAALYAGLLAGPIAWLISLEAGYGLSYKACAARATAFLLAATLAPLIIIAVAAWAVHRTEPASAPDYDARWPVWMARAGLMLCAFFALVILANAVPTLVLDPCR
jgi:hypothetical protein